MQKPQHPVEELDIELLKHSRLLDETFYRRAALLPNHACPYRDYLSKGWKNNIEPAPMFEGAWLYPYYRSVGFEDAPALTFLMFRECGYAAYFNREEAEKAATLIRKSNLFDLEYYKNQLGRLSNLDPILHYVLVGEQLGYRPSPCFDPNYYKRRYADIDVMPVNRLGHYLRSGKKELRRPIYIAENLAIDLSRIDPKRPSILLVSHQASRTGAPILAYNIANQLRKRYNVVTLLLSGGEIAESFADVSDAIVGPLDYRDWHHVEFMELVTRLTHKIKVEFAIANSIETHVVMKALSTAFVPVLALVHEFANHLQPPGSMGRALEWATQIVFPSPLVLESVKIEYPNIDDRPVHILPQGPCAIPQMPLANTLSQTAVALDAIRPDGSCDMRVVIGCGTVTPRKGVDLFFKVAATVARMRLPFQVRFVWIGDEAQTDDGRHFYSAIERQIRSLDVAGNAVLVRSVSDLEPIYEAADLFFLSSRLDPLPNVAIDSMIRALPLICFSSASGIAEILERRPLPVNCIAPNFSIEAASEIIACILADENRRRSLGQAQQSIAKSSFDMAAYIDKLVEIGGDAIQIMNTRRHDFQVLNSDGSFDMFTSLDPRDAEMTREEAISLFVHRAGAIGASRLPTANFYFRRPCPGFHPQIYIEENGARYDSVNENPLAHYIKNGKPRGRWINQVLRPEDMAPASTSTSARVAIHAHFHYPELLPDFLKKAARNQTRFTLLITTTSPQKEKQLRKALNGYAGAFDIRRVPNSGRDVGAFLTGCGADELASYDIVGHLHSKRSIHLGNPLVGETWREFLWQNLIGDLFPMMDLIVRQFAVDERLGLVFADDPHLSDWDFNREIAAELAARMGIRKPLPSYFNFPIGTMFWARPKALKPLLDLNLGWDDYPPEPLPIDGTALHAIERLIPFVAEHSGYKYATTAIFGLAW